MSKVFPQNSLVKARKFKKINKNEMIKKMCKMIDGELARLITHHIIIGYSPFTNNGIKKCKMKFNSASLLDWTCFSLDETECALKTYSIVCRYLLKNKKIDMNFDHKETSECDTLINKSDKVESPIPENIPVTTPSPIANDSFIEKARLYYPRSLFIYSSSTRLINNPFFQLIIIVTSILALASHL